MSPPPSMEPPHPFDEESASARFFSVAYRHDRDIRELQGEVFGDRRNNNTGIKANVATLVAVPARVDSVEKRMDKLEQNWVRKFWLGVASSGAIGNVSGALLVLLVQHLMSK